MLQQLYELGLLLNLQSHFVDFLLHLVVSLLQFRQFQSLHNLLLLYSIKLLAHFELLLIELLLHYQNVLFLFRDGLDLC